MRRLYVTEEKWEIVNEESKRLLKEFMLTLRAEGVSKSTKSSYLGNVKRFLVYVLDNLENRSILEITRKEIKSYGRYLVEDLELSTSTHNDYISSVRCFLDRLEEDEDVDYNSNTARKVKSLTIERVRDIVFLTDDQVTMLYNELIRTKKYQMALYLAMSYDSTGRRSEIMQVKKSGFYEIAKNSTNQVFKKGHKKESLVYFERSKEAAALWLEQRPNDNIDSMWVRYDKDGRPIARSISSPASWCLTMDKILTLLQGKPIHFTPHCLRHSAIENLTEGSHYKCEVRRIPFEIKTVSKLASHSTTDMTNSYKKDHGMRDVADAFGINLAM